MLVPEVCVFSAAPPPPQMTYTHTERRRWRGLELRLIIKPTYQEKMGNTDSKLNFRKAVIQLTTKTQVCVVAAVIRGGYQERARARVFVSRWTARPHRKLLFTYYAPLMQHLYIYMCRGATGVSFRIMMLVTGVMCLYVNICISVAHSYWTL